MGKAGRIACIFTPYVLTIASFLCLVLIELAGWNKGFLPDYYFMQVNFTNLDVNANNAGSTEALTLALKDVQGNLADIYDVHLWNYCTSDSSNGTIDFCTPRKAEFTFNPIEVWGINVTKSVDAANPKINVRGAISNAANNAGNAAQNAANNAGNAAKNAANSVENSLQSIENTLLGNGTADALNTYRKASNIMFILYAVAFWTTAATIILGIFAICSRWGSLFTWIFATISSIVNLAAVGLTTGIFVTLTTALKGALDPYNVTVHLGDRLLIVAWLGVAFSWAATLFWLFSVCCCSGRSNPHHKSNKGGLWNAEPKGYGYESPVSDKHASSGSHIPLNVNVYAAHPSPSPYEPYRHA